MSTTPPAPQTSAPSYNQQMLAQIRGVLRGKLLDGVAMYKIGDRELTNIPLPDLMKAEAYYESRCRQELRRQKGLGQRFVPVIFGAAEERASLSSGFWFAGLLVFLILLFIAGIIGLAADLTGAR